MQIYIYDVKLFTKLNPQQFDFFLYRLESTGKIDQFHLKLFE